MGAIRKEFWTASQRRGVIVLICVLLSIAATELAVNSSTIPKVQPERGVLATQLADRLDPNTAIASQLSEITDIGPARAAAIIAYRSQFQTEHPGNRAFEKLEDLRKIRGIGPAISETIGPYLTFQDSASTRN
jgi:competence ComEA-like helix-hairpin-helix protein